MWKKLLSMKDDIDATLERFNDAKAEMRGSTEEYATLTATTIRDLLETDWAIGESGAKNAALLAVGMLGTTDPDLRARLHRFRARRDPQQIRFG